MEQTFEPTVRHYTLLRYMDDETKTALKLMMDTIGYYHTIRCLMDDCNQSSSNAKVLADIGCYMLK